jgi:hypothetical protein
MTPGTLQRGLNREPIKSGDSETDGKRLVRVKVVGGTGELDLDLPEATQLMARPAQGFEFQFFGLVFFCLHDDLVITVLTCEFWRVPA